MRLITKNGELDLPEDFSFEIEKCSTFFSSDGEQSIPVTLPATPRNLAALGRPLRLVVVVVLSVVVVVFMVVTSLKFYERIFPSILLL